MTKSNVIEADVDGNVMEVTLPKFGDAISNGTVIDYTHRHDGGGGMLPNGLVLAALPWNTYHPYVVWNAAYSERSGWTCEVGSYCENITEAADVYKKRGGK